jgi:hypothetical protein
MSPTLVAVGELVLRRQDKQAGDLPGLGARALVARATAAYLLPSLVLIDQVGCKTQWPCRHRPGRLC